MHDCWGMASSFPMYRKLIITDGLTFQKKLILRKLLFSQRTIKDILSSEAATNAEKVTVYGCMIKPGDEEAVSDLFANYFSNNRYLKMIELSSLLEEASSDCTRTLVWTVTHATTMRSFRLNMNTHGICLQGFCEKLVASNPMLEVLKLPIRAYPPSIEKLSCTLMGPTFLKELDFSDMEIGDRTFARLANAMCSASNLSKSLEVLNLSRNRIEELPILTRLLNEMSCLQCLDLCGNGGLFQCDHAPVLDEDDNNNEMPHHCQEFMKAIASHKNLSALLIRACSMHDQDAYLLFDALTVNTSIQQVDLDFNLIEIQGVKHLINALPRMKGLRTLEMDDLEVEAETSVHDNDDDDNNNNDENDSASLMIPHWGRCEQEDLVAAVRQNLSLCALELDRRLFTGGVMKQEISRILKANKLLHAVESAVNHNLHHNNSSSSRLGDPNIVWQLLLNQISTIFHDQPRRQATAIYGFLHRKEW